MPTYKITQSVPNHEVKEAKIVAERLVEAANKSAAIRHVAADTITAEPVSIADAMRLSKAGVTVEKAGE